MGFLLQEHFFLKNMKQTVVRMFRNVFWLVKSRRDSTGEPRLQLKSWMRFPWKSATNLTKGGSFWIMINWVVVSKTKSPLFGEDSYFDKHIFQMGLKPPTSKPLPLKKDGETRKPT